MADWEIKKTLGLCFGTGREFAVGEEYFAALVETEAGLERRDYSIEHWNQSKPQVYCFWKSKMPSPDQKKRLFVDDGMLMAFFERLATETEPEKVNFRFVLNLVLMRKRKLKYEGCQLEDGREIWTVRVTGQDRFEKVINPRLTEDQIEGLTGQMGQILQMDFEAGS
ncbi:MAG: hypothetical protein LLF76_14610 [Planctomycetaceae bacterium]|nr:hypothetical protein [Planctomycetaceae bacterium]